MRWGTKMIKFHKHYVTDGNVKARVIYISGQVFVRRPDGKQVIRDCISLYAKDYGATLRKFPELAATNDTEIMSDYIVEDVARIFHESPLYPAVKARLDEIAAQRAARRSNAEAKENISRAAFVRNCPMPLFPSLRADVLQ